MSQRSLSVARRLRRRYSTQRNPTMAATYADIQQLIPAAQRRMFRRLSVSRSVVGLSAEWAGIVVAILLCERYFSIPLYLFSVLWISARILGLGLFMHDGVHGLVAKSRYWNDWISELFAAWPLFISARSYRVKHLAHHANLNTADDPDWIAKSNPDWRFPMSPRRLFGILLRYLTGMAFIDSYRQMSANAALTAHMQSRGNAKTYHCLRILYYLLLACLLWYSGFGMLFLKYWIVPLATGLQLLNGMRRIAEHSAISNHSALWQTRTTIHGFWSRLFLSPKNIAYHNEHHLFPNVPWYRLPELHRKLMQHSLARATLQVTRSYAGVYLELIR